MRSTCRLVDGVGDGDGNLAYEFTNKLTYEHPHTLPNDELAYKFAD